MVVLSVTVLEFVVKVGHAALHSRLQKTPLAPEKQANGCKAVTGVYCSWEDEACCWVFEGQLAFRSNSQWMHMCTWGQRLFPVQAASVTILRANVRQGTAVGFGPWDFLKHPTSPSWLRSLLHARRRRGPRLEALAPTFRSLQAREARTSNHMLDKHYTDEEILHPRQ